MEIAFKTLIVGYQRGILHAINLELSGAGLTCIVGLNGMGKTTLLRTLAALEHPVSGTVEIDNKNIHALNHGERSKLVSVILTGKPFIYNMSVMDVLALGRYPHLGLLANLQEADLQIMKKVLEQLNIAHLAQKQIDQVSDGELQLILVARALCQQTPCIIMDEPTAFLDIKNRKLLFQIMRDICESQNKRVLLSTHELDMALQYAHDFICIDSSHNVIGIPNNGAAKASIEMALGI
jgi:iron complex transport system ATP-binding protein